MKVPFRVQLSRKAGWRKPENTVVVARPTKWGNPYKVGAWVRLDGGHLPVQIKTAEVSVGLFKAQAMEPLIGANLRANAQRYLRGKNLACWCALDQPCHADVLLAIANE